MSGKLNRDAYEKLIEEDLAELAKMLDGYEDVSQPREVPESILARARDAIRALQAENERLRESDAKWSVFAEECGKEREILAAQRDEARREHGKTLLREGKACLARDAAEEELEAVREECQHLRENLENLRMSADDRGRALEKAEAQLAALRPRAEALEMLEKWLRESPHRYTSITVRDGLRVKLNTTNGAWTGEADDLASAIRAAVGKADG